MTPQMASAADPERLAAELPSDPPAGWQRSDTGGGVVEYRLPGDADRRWRRA